MTSVETKQGYESAPMIMHLKKTAVKTIFINSIITVLCFSLHNPVNSTVHKRPLPVSNRLLQKRPTLHLTMGPKFLWMFELQLT